MPLRAKWAELLKYLRLILFVVLFLFLALLFIVLVAGSDGRSILPTIILALGILLALLIIVYLIFKLVEYNALKKRLDWLITQLELPEENEILEELRLAVIDYNPEMKEKTCSICALEMGEKALIISCLKCDKIFHKEHFIVWLRENERCPNCKNLILPFD